MHMKKIKELRNDSKYILTFGVIFLFVMIVFVLIGSITSEKKIEDKTYTFDSNASISLNKTLLDSSKENTFNILICEYSDMYNKCDELEKFLLSKNKCCKMNYCC